ncbi:homoserine o-acetyltransferas-like protein [Hyaloscypha bicolor E]|uniref:Homoserine o-acetyltransferas-like protein n=1 Tax=Hyaloscypha bicolor E TaxID=1095630 RepID=A0A2J6STK8_9HELO|nr:homoserine o-acetyltransferas-like protein [Hyaloscypha bicolor E]PMD54118.1 homoserine o-acetyltransferas-like protein [Hyaloscypha bicolor E]
MTEYVQERTQQQPENPFASLIPDQAIAIIPSFTLESGVTLHNVPLAYSTRGKLSPTRDNAMVICHALTGSADVGDWWGPLLGGPGRAFDISRFFVICMNSLGSPYGSASPVTCKDGDPQKERYGPEFPLTTIRDDVNLHKVLLDDLGVRQIAVAIGGSMGGMLVLEWAYFGQDYVRSIVPIATSSRHSAWGISWGEAQRQSIYADPKYDDGYYPFSDPPSAGLGAARMSALLTYRSRNSFEARFGRNTPDASKKQTTSEAQHPADVHLAIHNDGHRATRSPLSGPRSSANLHTAQTNGNSNGDSSSVDFTDPQFHYATVGTPLSPQRTTSTYFSAQSYLRYQGQKFVKRFDGNCYIAITRKLDTHDVSRYRASPDSENPIADALAQIEQPTLILGIESDGLFTFDEQKELASYIPNARLRKIDSPEGHDAFLLQFEQVNQHILDFLREVLPDIMEAPGNTDVAAEDGVGAVTKNSTFGEAEVEDMTAW